MSDHKWIQVNWQGKLMPVAVMYQFENYLEEFSEEVDGQLNAERCPFGVLLWPSARVLAQQLARNLLPPRDSELRIFDLGCGVGFLSCVLARLYPRSQVFACDYEENLKEFVEINAASWGVQSQIHFMAIDWRKPCPEAIRSSADWVLGSDVFYDASHVSCLPNFSAKLLKPGARLTLAGPDRQHLQSALAQFMKNFQLISSKSFYCSTQEDGIEEILYNRGVSKQKINIVHLEKTA